MLGVERVELQALYPSRIGAKAPNRKVMRDPAEPAGSRLPERDAAQPVWQANCDHCNSPECEHALMRERRPTAD
jgi:hypothetical protein